MHEFNWYEEELHTENWKYKLQISNHKLPVHETPIQSCELG